MRTFIITSTVLIIIIVIELAMLKIADDEIAHIKQFTGYKNIPGVIEHCEGKTVINDSVAMWDRAKRDSIYQLILKP